MSGSPSWHTAAGWPGCSPATAASTVRQPSSNAVEELAYGREIAILLLGEHHVRGVLEHDELGIWQPPRHLLSRGDRAYPVVTARQDEQGMRRLAEPILDVDPAVVLGCEMADDVGR